MGLESLLYLDAHEATGDTPEHHTWVAIHDAAVFTMLAEELLRLLKAAPDERCLLIADSATIQQHHTLAKLRRSSSHLLIFGADLEIEGDKNLQIVPFHAEFTAADRCLVILSPSWSAALIGTQRPPDAESGADTFVGGWTVLRTLVEQTYRQLRWQAAGNGSERLPRAAAGAADEMTRLAMHLSRLLTNHLLLLHEDATMDRHNLYSVLEILKAVSSKRRSHDVLYIFVEQIARVVQMDRCSVVRVWTEEKMGHVLASHEDESISGLTIDLDKYPELRQSLNTFDKVVIQDTRQDPLTREFHDELAAAGIRSLVVIPIVLYDPNVGSLLLRAARAERPFTLREISFCEIVAEAASNALERAHLFETIQRANDRLERLAITDGLTGVYNHRYFVQRVEEEFERSRRYRLPLACLIFDIDNFKKLNDTYGHLLGDSVLREMAELTSRTVRKSDLVARYGGEEFTVIMPQTEEEGALKQAKRLCDEVRAFNWSGLPRSKRVTISIGVAVVNHDRMERWEDLIRVADDSLYQAKREGKDRVIMGTVKGES